MFNLLKSFGAGRAKPSPMELFGEGKISRQLGLEVAQGTPARRNYLQGLRDQLTSMTCEEKDELIDRIFARLALFVFDLPASESSHHSERFGLFDHLLEVAFQTARTLSAPGFKVSPEAAVHHHEGPRWVYAGVVAAIAHDIGKPLDLDVVSPGSSTCWDPRSEPLRLFCVRNHLSGTAPGLWHFHKGRGTETHERNIPTLLPMVLTPQVKEYLGPRLRSVLEVLASDEPWNSSAGKSHLAREVVKVVKRMDQASSIDDRQRKHPKAGHPSDGPLVSQGIQVREIPGSHDPAGPVQGVAPPPRGEALPLPELRDGAPHIPADGPGPVCVPPCEWMKTIKWEKERRGDPTETALRIARELNPSTFLKTLHRMTVQFTFDRNSLYSHIYLRPDYVWMIVPGALKKFTTFRDLPWNPEVMAKMLASLRALPQVEPLSAHELASPIKPREDSSRRHAIRIKREGFLSERELAELKIHESQIHDLDGRIPEGAAL